MTIHKSVLLGEAIENLNLKEGSVVVDATLGSGGHAKEIIKSIGEEGFFIGLDVDCSSIDNFKFQISNFKTKGRIYLINDNFSNLDSILKSLEIGKVDAILADLGYSSDQLENPDYGMSFLIDAPLDMRLDKKKGLTAKIIVNKYSQEELLEIIRKFGEERYALRITRKIINTRKEKEIETTGELAEIIKSAVAIRHRNQKIHPATKTFQALRIAVNQELENLETFIDQAIDNLAEKGRLAIISFHSLEDRIIKNKFKENARGCICPPNFPQCVCNQVARLEIVTRKPLIADSEEVRINPRSRSAKLRVVEKK